jgi:hypothetical protein
VKARLHSHVSPMNCQMFVTGFGSGMCSSKFPLCAACRFLMH